MSLDIWRFILKANIHLQYNQAIALLDIYPRRIKVYTSIKDLYNNNFIYNIQKMVSNANVDQKWNKQIIMYSYNEILLSNKKKFTKNKHNNVEVFQNYSERSQRQVVIA